MYERVKENKHTNITVLAPRNAYYEAFFTLGRLSILMSSLSMTSALYCVQRDPSLLML